MARRARARVGYRRLTAVSLLVFAMASFFVWPAKEASAQEAAEGMSAQPQLAEQILGNKGLLSKTDLQDMLSRANAAPPAKRLSLLFRRMRASLGFHDESLVLEAAEDLRKAAADSDAAEYLLLTDIYDAYAASFGGRIYEALQHLSALRQTAEQESAHWLAIGTLNQFIAALAPSLGQIHHAAGSLQTAFELDLPDTLHATILRADLYMVLGLLDAVLSSPSSATGAFHHALSLTEDSGIHIDRVAMLYNLGLLKLQQQRFEQATQVFSRLEAAALAADRPRARFYAIYGLMKTAQLAGNPQLSSYHAERALAAHEPAPLFAAAIAQHQTSNMVSLGRLDEARAQLDLAKTYLERWPDLASTRYSVKNIRLASDLAEAEGRFQDALSLYREHAAALRRHEADVFSRDVLALRMQLERELTDARTKRAIAEQQKALASSRLRTQRIWLIIAAMLIASAVFAVLYQRRMARALDRSRRKAEQANAAKTSFLANISHELRTPLNAIIGFSEMSAREMLGPIGNPAYRSYAESIHRSGRHLLAVINDILDLSRVEAGRCSLEEEELSLADILTQSVEMLRPRLEAKSQTLDIRDIENLPMLRGDPRLLRQCFTNLLSNANKFTPDGGRICVRGACEASGELRIFVEDTGIGMSEEDIATAFEPFGQVESAFTRVHEGTGLGLPLVKNFIALHGGRVIIRSRKGEGTVVRLSFPPERVLSTSRIPKLDEVDSSSFGKRDRASELMRG